MGSGSSLLSCGAFLPLPLLQVFLLLVAEHVLPLLLACLFTVLWGVAPSPVFSAQGAQPSLLCVFLLLLLIIQFFFSFFPGGAMLIWPRVVCGRTACRLAHLVVCIFPSSLGTSIWWQHRSPWFLRSTWSGNAMHRLGMWRSQSFASSQWFCL
jgi:hypothetical protein